MNDFKWFKDFSGRNNFRRGRNNMTINSKHMSLKNMTELLQPP